MSGSRPIVFERLQERESAQFNFLTAKAPTLVWSNASAKGGQKIMSFAQFT